MPGYLAQAGAWPEAILEAGSCLVEGFNANHLFPTPVSFDEE